MAETNQHKQQFPDTPSGWAQRWGVEFEAARKDWTPFSEAGEKAENRYLSESTATTGLNLFYGDIEHKKALLYGNPPQVRVTRRYADPDDDEARVAAEMQGRLLNSDIQRRTDAFRVALGQARDDRLLPGIGIIRFRYVAEFEDVPEVPAQVDPTTGAELAPAVPAGQRKVSEDVATDYVNWRDFLWGPARVWEEVPWVAFGSDLTMEKLHERFDSTIANGDEEEGKRLVSAIGLNAKDGKENKDNHSEDPWARARVWEIWYRESREVFWYVEGYPIILDRKPDPLGLDSFWPCPRPLFANVTSKKLVPKPDIALHQNLYNAIDDLHERRQRLIQAVRVTGVYDGSNEGLEHVVEGGENKLYPIKNWAAYVEGGGLHAGVQLMSLKEIIEAIDVLTQKLQEAIALKDQAVGIADVMRGQATPGGGVTATERRIQARSASTRQKAAQEDFARFTTDAQNIRAEIIAKLFDAETIIERSNVLRTRDRDKAPAAAELIKSQFGQFRIEVAADGLAMTDYDAVKAERVEVVTALGGLMQAAQPIVQMGGPQAMGFVLEVAGWLMAATPGGSQMEGVFDKFKARAEQAAATPKPPPPPDPKVEAAKIGLETKKLDAQASAMGARADMQKTMLEGRVAQMKGSLELQKLDRQARVEAIRAAQPQREPEEVA